MPSNIFQTNIIPNKPRILQDERVFVYVPTATKDTAGIAKFKTRDFIVNNGLVELSWPMQMQIERISNPLEEISMVKVLSEEFIQTNESASLTNPVTGDKYSTTSAEIKLRRTNRNAFERPDLVMLDGENDFDVALTSDAYSMYTIKKNNPLEKPSIVQVSQNDFNYDGIVSVAWPYAKDQDNLKNEGFGLMRLAPNSDGYLKYDTSGNTEVDMTKMSKLITEQSDLKPNYEGNFENGFVDIGNYVDENGLAKRSASGATLIALTKNSVGLSKVANKSFDEYVYNDFGTTMKSDFKVLFDAKVNQTSFDKFFGDWNPPTVAKDTPQKWFENLEQEDESLWDTLKTIRLFLGYFDDFYHLTSLYPANNITFGSIAYLIDYRTYWIVRTSNANKMFATDTEATSYVPPKDSKGKYIYDIYITGSKASKNRWQWTSTTNRYVPIGTPGDAQWVDYFLGNDEELASFIEEHKYELSIGDRIGIRETNQMFIWNGFEPELAQEKVFYQWYDTCMTNLSFMDFVEKSPLAFKPDGVPAAGSSGLWAQSDHVHPIDESRLSKQLYKDTNVTIGSEFTDNVATDFKFPLWEQDENGNYLPNRKVNIPFVRKSKTIYNSQGQATFTDTVDSSEHYWAGSALEFTNEADAIPNNSIIMVDDNEDFLIENLVNIGQFDIQGITIDSYHPYERFVITDMDEVDSCIGHPLTLKKEVSGTGNDRFEIVPIELGNDEGLNVVTKLVNGKITISQVQTIPNKLIYSDSNGRISTLNYDMRNVVITGTTPTQATLTASRLTKSGPNNTILTVDTGAVADRPLLSDGLGTLYSKSFIEGTFATYGPNSTLQESQFYTDNILVTKVSKSETVILPSGQVLISGLGNQVTTKDTGSTSGKMLLTDGLGGIQVATTQANKLLYTSAAGLPNAFPMSAGDVGKYVGVDATGTPTLLTPPSLPLTLPISTFTSNPGTNVNGMVLCKLANDPGTYNQGVLYLW